MLMHTYNPSTGVVEAGRSEVPGHPQLHSETETSLDYMQPCLKDIKPK